MSEFVGEKKKRLIFRVHYYGKHVYENNSKYDMYPLSCLHYFKDWADNRISWNSTSLYIVDGNKKEVVPSPETFIEIKATIKEHFEFKNGKRTTVSRVKFLRYLDYSELGE